MNINNSDGKRLFGLDGKRLSFEIKNFEFESFMARSVNCVTKV